MEVDGDDSETVHPIAMKIGTYMHVLEEKVYRYIRSCNSPLEGATKDQLELPHLGYRKGCFWRCRQLTSDVPAWCGLALVSFW